MFELVSVSVVSSIFWTLVFVGFIIVNRVLIGQTKSYSNISKNVLFFNLIPINDGVTKYFLRRLQGSI